MNYVSYIVHKCFPFKYNCKAATNKTAQEIYDHPNTYRIGCDKKKKCGIQNNCSDDELNKKHKLKCRPVIKKTLKTNSYRNIGLRTLASRLTAVFLITLKILYKDRASKGRSS